MTDRQKCFVAEYARGGDPAEAAVRAGYSPRRARRQASELLRREEIAEAIRARQEREAAAAGGASPAPTGEPAAAEDAGEGLAPPAHDGQTAGAGKRSHETGDDDISRERIVSELARIAFAGSEVRDGDKLRALEMLTKLAVPDSNGDGEDAVRCGVVILPEVAEA